MTTTRTDRSDGMTNDELEQLAYGWMGAGWRTFPIELRELPSKTEKRPVTTNGHLDATVDPAAFAQMLSDARRRHDGAVLGVGGVPGPAGAVVLDFDTKNGARGGLTLARMLEAHPGIDAVRYRSISGATNLIVGKRDASVIVGNTAPRAWTDTDVRSDRGWIVLPGVRCPWGSWDWLPGSLGLEATPAIPLELWAELTAVDDTSFGPADLEAIKRWFDAGGAVTDPFYARAIAGWCQTLATCGSRNPTLFDALTWLRRMPAADIDRKAAFVELDTAWRARMAADGMSGRDGEPWSVLTRVVGYELGVEPEVVPDDETLDDELMRRAREYAVLLEVQAIGRELYATKRLHGFTTAPALVGMDAVGEWIEAGGDRCLWGTGETILLARGESLMIAGREGVGKTTIAAQVARARLGGLDPLGVPWRVLGHLVDPLEDADAVVVYLALDRPRQVARLLAAMFEGQPDEVRSRMLVIRAPALEAVQAGRAAFLEWLLAQVDGRPIGLAILDSLKDVMLKPTSDEEAGRWHVIRSAIVGELDVPLIELHHLKKRTEEGGNDSVFGSALLTAGPGSILQIHGRPGDGDYLLEHTKMPAWQQPPLKITHHYGTEGLWWSEVLGTQSDDVEAAVFAAGDAGATVPELVERIVDERKPAARRKMIQRELKRLAAARRVHEVLGTDAPTSLGGRPASRWIHGEATPSETPENDPEKQGFETAMSETKNDDLPGDMDTTERFGTPLGLGGPRPLGLERAESEPADEFETAPATDQDSPDIVGLTVPDAVALLGSSEAVIAAADAANLYVDDDGVIRRALD